MRKQKKFQSSNDVNRLLFLESILQTLPNINNLKLHVVNCKEFIM